VKEEIRRINKLVAEGKLSPDDAADLIEAMMGSGPADVSEAAEPATEGSGEPADSGKSKDPFRSLFDSIEKVVTEGKDSVNWDEVLKQTRDTAKQGIDKLKKGIDDISKGKLNVSWFTAQETRDVTLPLKYAPGKTMKIENPVGSVKVVGGFDEGAVIAKVRVKGATFEDAKKKAEEYTLIVEEGDHHVSIKQPDVVGLHVELEVQMPGHGAVEVKAESGDVEILESKGSARISTRSGDVVLRGLEGPIEVTAESADVRVDDSNTSSLVVTNKTGDISLTRVVGNMNVRTATGDVTVRQSSGKVVSVESVSGQVHVDLDQPVSGSLNIRTVNGHALIAAPDGCDCRVSLSTLRGEVACSLDLEDEARAEQRITGRLGAGAGTLDVSAVTGNITLEMHSTTVSES
jgi:DUF4097 and DUF4098 domain-containing protein YvlB